QASACFINSVQDTMESILELVKTEGMLFKYGSGTGTNFSTLRSSKEKLSGGGIASGPVSFMRGFDAFAGVIKSGGKTRRAAKMVILNVDHPDIIDFIKSKAEEEKKAHILIKAGYDPGFNVPGGAYDSVQFQNANHSVRVTDEFMKAVLEDKE
ncbi:Ribonucleotide reductase, barrel domain, partial [Candidatus Kryptonium thompsonii]